MILISFHIWVIEIHSELISQWALQISGFGQIWPIFGCFGAPAPKNLSLFPPDRTVQSGARTHRALTHQQKIIRIFPHFSALNPCYLRLIFYTTGASATIRMLPALNKQRYRRLHVNLYATSANHFRCVAQPQQCICTKRMLPALNPLRYGHFRNNATSVYASICELPAPTISDASHSHNDASTLT